MKMEQGSVNRRYFLIIPKLLDEVLRFVSLSDKRLYSTYCLIQYSLLLPFDNQLLLYNTVSHRTFNAKGIQSFRITWRYSSTNG